MNPQISPISTDFLEEIHHEEREERKEERTRTCPNLGQELAFAGNCEWLGIGPCRAI